MKTILAGCSPCSRAHRSQRGVAIIMAILVTALAASLSSVLLLRTDRWLNQVALSQQYAQTRELARSALDYAIAILQEDARRSVVDHLGEDWARRLPPISAEGGEIEGYIEDLQGRWNLNNVHAWNHAEPNSLRISQRLFELNDLEPMLAHVLLDWVDANDQSHGSFGAESSYYRSGQPPYTAANVPLSSIATLERLKGFEVDDVARLRPYASALPGVQAVNVNTAPAKVLAAIVPGLNLAQANELVDHRKTSYYRNVADFRKQLPNPDVLITHPVVTQSYYFLVHVRARYGKARASLQALVQRRSSNKPKIYWISLN